MSNEDYNIEEDVAEESIAGATLRPNSRPTTDDPKSKIEAITSVIGAMHSMRKDDLQKWFRDAMNLIGKGASSLPGSANDKSNKSSINMKGSDATGSGGASSSDTMPHLDSKNNPLAKILSVKEDVQEMFAGQDLSEEFKEKAEVIFEAAIHARAMMEIARLEEAYEQQLEEGIQEIAESLEVKIDSYLDYVVEKWMDENQVAIESTLRNEVMEEFVGGLKNLFKEHYIEVPEEKIDVIEELSTKVEQLETMLDGVISENVDLKKFVVEAERQEAVVQMHEGLTITQQEKFEALAEGIEFNGDVDEYRKKLSYVKETYFPQKKKYVSNIEEDVYEGDHSDDVPTNSEVSAYVKAISRTIKK